MAYGSKQGKPAPLIGILAVKHKFISEAQLQSALDQCGGAPDLEEKLKAYFLAEKLISKQNIQRLTTAVKAVAIHRQEYRFGAIALAKGVVNKIVLDLALEEQKELFQKGKKPRPIGDVMVESGIITIKQRDEIIKLQKQSCASPDKVGNLPVAQDPADTLPVDDEAHSTPANNSSGAPDSNDAPILDRLEDLGQICGGLLLQVTCDHMSAFLTKICDMDPDIPAVVIRTALSEKGIVYGLASDEQLEDFIKSPIADFLLFRVAQGVEPSPGKETRIEFFFNTAFLKSSGMDDSGNIDGKRDNTRLVVEKGTVLAEKIAGTSPLSGKDVFGNAVSVTGTANDPFRAGPGAVLSEDGQKVLAMVRGTPRMTLAGSIAVHERYDINGDIDNDTGIGECDRNLRVTGGIKSDARVCGVDIWAQDIDNGVVKANGDLTIANGINNARVYARGNVHAQSISNSEIVCMGDVLVEKKIVDSKIECAGACSVITGQLVSSQVAAKMGLMAGSVCSETDGPSKIRVGHDAFSARELEINRAEAKRIEKLIQKFNNQKNTTSRQAAGLKTQMTELERVRERLLVKYREIESRSDQSPSDRESLEQRLTGLRKNLKTAETKLKGCAEKIKDLVQQATKIDRQLIKPAASREILADEKKNLTCWSLHTPGTARVIVDENIVSGTIIMGLHSTFVSENELCHVRITERPAQSDDEGNPQIFYQMQVDDL